MSKRTASTLIDAAAADWAARLDRGPLSADERAAIEAWMASDPRRAGALARAMAVMARVDRSAATVAADRLKDGSGDS